MTPRRVTIEGSQVNSTRAEGRVSRKSSGSSSRQRICEGYCGEPVEHAKHIEVDGVKRWVCDSCIERMKEKARQRDHDRRRVEHLAQETMRNDVKERRF